MNAITVFHPDQIEDESNKWEGMLYPGPDFEQQIIDLYNNAPKKLEVKWGQQKIRNLDRIQDKFNQAISS